MEPAGLKTTSLGRFSGVPKVDNERDQIVGTSTTKSGQRHVGLWTLRRG